MKMIFWYIAILCLLPHKSISVNDEFHEELFVKPLSSGHIYNHFQFTTILKSDLKDKLSFYHLRLFPKPLAEVFYAYKIQELHLSLSHGLWRHEKWGYPIRSAPPGAEVAVWFQDDIKNIDNQWQNFRNVLSGMFCASLNFMDSKSTVTPKFSFKPTGATSAYFNNHIVSQTKNIRYSALPRETVCTENLTPWKKLLPCGDRFGLSSILNARKIYDSHYHSLGVDFRPICSDIHCNETYIELTLSLSVVFNMIRNDASQDWSLRELYSYYLQNSCQLSTTSKIIVDISSNKNTKYFYKLSPEPTQIFPEKFAVYDLKKVFMHNSVLNIIGKYNQKIFPQHLIQPTIIAQTYQTGYGEVVGGITTILKNNADFDQNVIVFQTIPWYFRVFFHTLSFRTYLNDMTNGTGTRLRPTKLFFSPGKDRLKSYHVESILRLPSKTTTHIHFEFERALLRWTEYPPDAHHGFYVNSPVISLLVNYKTHSNGLNRNTNVMSETLLNSDLKDKHILLQIYSESLLMVLPTPDFSMPYNVICLACTVVAIGFGSVHNVTTRLLKMKDPDEPHSPLGKFKAKLVSKFYQIFGKKSEEKKS